MTSAGRRQARRDHRARALEAWFVTGSQHLYGEAVLERVGEHAREIAAHLDGAADVPVRIVWRPVVTTSEEIRGVLREADAAPDCVGVVAWMHTFSPAKMWIAGLTDLRKPLVHLHTQYNRDLPWAEIDMEFMNLHQSAHGDREFAFIQTRLRRGRKTVVGHWQDRWSHGAWGRGRARRPAGTRPSPAHRPVRRQHARGRGHRRRQGRGAGSPRLRGQRLRRKRSRPTGRGRERRRCRQPRGHLRGAYDVVPDLRRAGEPARRAAHGRADRGRVAVLPRGGRLRGVHRHVRGPARAQAAARDRRPALDGRRLWLRRRG